MSTNIGRRDFLKAAAAASAVVVGASAVRSAGANSKIEIGLIGCGGRGKWIGDLFEQNANAKIVAVHDYFKDRMDEAGEKLKVDASRRYSGLDGYKRMLESKLDAVAIISPPCFHPEQAVAAMQAGKHVYLAKPISVDVPGAVSIVQAADRVRDKLSVLVDFQTRANDIYKSAVQRVHDGTIGTLVCGQAYYHDSRLGIQATPGTEQARLRNWVFDKALSGDIIVEQNIHVLDVANWFLKSHPAKAVGTGGRKARIDVGDCWDHFVVTYTYPNGFILDFSSGQFTYGFSDLCCRVYGSTGSADTHYGGIVTSRARTGGTRTGETRDIYREGAVTNIKAFCASIASGKFLNNASDAADSTMTSILGRIAAYEGRPVTWDEMLAANTRMDLKLNLPADGPDWKG
jgi:predicted dehydrogenase